MYIHNFEITYLNAIEINKIEKEVSSNLIPRVFLGQEDPLEKGMATQSSILG